MDDRDRQEQEVQVVEDILRSVETEKKLGEKSDSEIADLLLEHVWYEMDVWSPHADLVEAAIERLRGGQVEVVSLEALPKPAVTMVSKYRDPVINLLRQEADNLKSQRDELLEAVDYFLKGYDLILNCDCVTCKEVGRIKALVDKIRSDGGREAESDGLSM